MGEIVGHDRLLKRENPARTAQPCRLSTLGPGGVEDRDEMRGTNEAPRAIALFGRDDVLDVVLLVALIGEEVRQRGVFVSVGLLVRAGLIAIEGR